LCGAEALDGAKAPPPVLALARKLTAGVGPDGGGFDALEVELAEACCCDGPLPEGLAVPLTCAETETWALESDPAEAWTVAVGVELTFTEVDAAGVDALTDALACTGVAGGEAEAVVLADAAGGVV
jgi:hypothetical protein